MLDRNCLLSLPVPTIRFVVIWLQRSIDWHWRADVAYWKGERALGEGRKEDAVEFFERALELNIPGYTWPALETRLRLEQLG